MERFTELTHRCPLFCRHGGSGISVIGERERRLMRISAMVCLDGVSSD